MIIGSPTKASVFTLHDSPLHYLSVYLDLDGDALAAQASSCGRQTEEKMRRMILEDWKPAANKYNSQADRID